MSYGNSPRSYRSPICRGDHGPGELLDAAPQRLVLSASPKSTAAHLGAARLHPPVGGPARRGHARVARFVIVARATYADAVGHPEPAAPGVFARLYAAVMVRSATCSTSSRSSASSAPSRSSSTSRSSTCCCYHEPNSALTANRHREDHLDDARHRRLVHSATGSGRSGTATGSGSAREYLLFFVLNGVGLAIAAGCLAVLALRARTHLAAGRQHRRRTSSGSAWARCSASGPTGAGSSPSTPTRTSSPASSASRSEPAHSGSTGLVRPG